MGVSETQCLKIEINTVELEKQFNKVFYKLDEIYKFKQFENIDDAARIFLRTFARYAIHPRPISTVQAELKAVFDFAGSNVERCKTICDISRVAFHSCWQDIHPAMTIIDVDTWNKEVFDAIEYTRKLTVVK